jgi:hypothetical protein
MLYSSHRELYLQFNKIYDKYPVLSDIVGGTWYSDASFYIYVIICILFDIKKRKSLLKGQCDT